MTSSYLTCFQPLWVISFNRTEEMPRHVPCCKTPTLHFLRKLWVIWRRTPRHGKDNRWQDKRRQFVVGCRGCLGILWQTLDSDTSPWWMGRSRKSEWFGVVLEKFPPVIVLSHSPTLSGVALTDRRRRRDLKQAAVWSSPYRFHSVTKIYAKSHDIKTDFSIIKVTISSLVPMHYTSITLTKSIL